MDHGLPEVIAKGVVERRPTRRSWSHPVRPGGNLVGERRDAGLDQPEIGSTSGAGAPILARSCTSPADQRELSGALAGSVPFATRISLVIASLFSTIGVGVPRRNRSIPKRVRPIFARSRRAWSPAKRRRRRRYRAAHIRPPGPSIHRGEHRRPLLQCNLQDSYRADKQDRGHDPQYRGQTAHNCSRTTLEEKAPPNRRFSKIAAVCRNPKTMRAPRHSSATQRAAS